jgi:hypothetical protein
MEGGGRRQGSVQRRETMIATVLASLPPSLPPSLFPIFTDKVCPQSSLPRKDSHQGPSLRR